MTTLIVNQGQSMVGVFRIEAGLPAINGLLVATDFSEQATLAVKIAVPLARQLGTRLHMLHIVSPLTHAPGGAGITPALREIDLRSAENRLRRYTARIPEARALGPEEIVLCGSVAEAIPAVVESKGIDLVAMGSHGRSGVGRHVFGSHAEHAVRHLHCPVLVAGPGCYSDFEALHSIVFATNLSAASSRPARYAASLAAAAGATLTLMHVLPYDPQEKAASREQAKNIAIEQLLLLASGALSRFEVAFGGPAEQILQAADRQEADLIVMGVNEHGVMADHAPWATLSEVIRHARCPVLAVRMQAA
jgi:nucleotide-binding universal stress UspA family protein